MGRESLVPEVWRMMPIYTLFCIYEPELSTKASRRNWAGLDESRVTTKIASWSSTPYSGSMQVFG